MREVLDWDVWESSAPASALFQRVVAALRDAPWFAHVGEASSADDTVVRVHSWDEACRMFSSGSAMAPSGTLRAPRGQLVHVLDGMPDAARETARIADEVLDSTRFSHRIPESLDLDASIAVGDYVTEFIRLLCIEWHVGNHVPGGCYYFRRQVPWFAAGFLPCGWDGVWPHGRLRVF